MYHLGEDVRIGAHVGAAIALYARAAKASSWKGDIDGMADAAIKSPARLSMLAEIHAGPVTQSLARRDPGLLASVNSELDAILRPLDTSALPQEANFGVRISASTMRYQAAIWSAKGVPVSEYMQGSRGCMGVARTPEPSVSERPAVRMAL